MKPYHESVVNISGAAGKFVGTPAEYLFLEVLHNEDGNDR
jgi:hypothetical protein